MAKTSKAHFEIYKVECKKWIDILGLKDWEIFYKHERDDDSRASCSFNVSGRIATLSLADEWDCPITGLELKKCAFHEAIELMLARLVITGRTRFIASHEIDDSVHEIVRRLENTFFEWSLVD